jgi:hypothetical protein
MYRKNCPQVGVYSRSFTEQRTNRSFLSLCFKKTQNELKPNYRRSNSVSINQPHTQNGSKKM